MNGEIQELFVALKEWDQIRHQENQKKFDKIFDKLDNLPCGERKGIYTYVKWHLGILTVALGVLIRVVIQHLIK